MKKIATITGLTWKSAFRYRLFWILAVLLAGAVLGLPLMLRDDGTAQGMVQILMTYTLSATAALLAFATLWLSCGTLAKDVEECQMQMVVVKPIARWQVWLGKWLGILSLDAVLLALSGAAIFFTLQWRAGRLPPDQQKILREDIFVSRASAREPMPDFTAKVDEWINQTVKNPSALSSFDLAELRKQRTAQLASERTDLPSGRWKQWNIDLHTLKDRLRDQRLQLRVKFMTGYMNDERRYHTVWVVGPPNSNKELQLTQELPPDSYQEFALPPNMLDDQGHLWIAVGNPNETGLTFPLEDGVELLYPESTFGINFIRGLTVIFCWLALLASIGLASASFLTFPVAAFVSVSVLFIGLSSTTLSTVVEQGTIVGYDSAKGGYGHSVVDYVLVPVFAGTLKIVKLVQSFSPIDSLSSGRSIRWGDLGVAAAQIVFLLSGFFCVAGIFLFSRRELATAQGNN